KAALKLGLKTVPVHVAVNLSPAHAKAYRLADNQTATLSQWDEDRLPLELAELQQMDFDLDLTGFSAEDLARLTEPHPAEGRADPGRGGGPPRRRGRGRPGGRPRGRAPWGCWAGTGCCAGPPPKRRTSIGCWAGHRCTWSTPTRRTTSRSSPAPTTPWPPASA